MEARNQKGQGEALKLRKYLRRGGKKWKILEGEWEGESVKSKKGRKKRAWRKRETAFPFVRSKF